MIYSSLGTNPQNSLQLWCFECEDVYEVKLSI